MSYSKFISISRSIVNKHKSLRRSSVIVFLTAVLINFIFQKVRLHVVEETGMTTAHSISVGKAYAKRYNSLYKSVTITKEFFVT